jgi:hypothetical protein
MKDEALDLMTIDNYLSNRINAKWLARQRAAMPARRKDYMYFVRRARWRLEERRPARQRKKNQEET